MLIAYWLTVAVVVTITVAFHFHRGTGLTSLIRFGGTRAHKLAPELAGVPVYLKPRHDGYDGQYYAHLALHPPWLHHDLSNHFDFPSYRARRIFLPAAAYALGLGQPAWIVHVYSLLNLAAWLGLAWLLTSWLPPVDWTSFGRWAGCLLAAGTIESLRASLTDLPALLLALGAVRFYQRRRTGAAVSVFALSILTRETMALSALGLFWPASGRFQGLARSALLGLAAVLPTIAWTLYVSHYFHDDNGSSGNFSRPFAALAQGASDAWSHLVHGPSDNGRYVFRLITIGAMAVQIGVVLRGYARGPEWFRFALAFVALFPFLGAAVWEGPWAIWRTELPVTVAFCFLAPAGRWFWPLLLAGSLPSMHALFRLAF